MRKGFDLKAGNEKITEKVELKNLILDKGSSSIAHAHYLSALVQLDITNLKPPVLWLDGSNSFNPYQISELSENWGINPEKSLEDIYISRAFTCYQMKSLILEKLGEGIKEFDPGPIIITGIIRLFSEADLSKSESLRVFKPVVGKLDNFRQSEQNILVTSPSGNEKERDFISQLEEISDCILGSERSSDTPHRNISHNWRKNADSEPANRTPTLEEFA